MDLTIAVFKLVLSNNALLKHSTLLLITAPRLHRLTNNILINQSQIIHTFGRRDTVCRLLPRTPIISIALYFYAFQTTFYFLISFDYTGLVDEVVFSAGALDW